MAAARTTDSIQVEIVSAPRLSLLGRTGSGAALARSDCNSPVRHAGARSLAFVSHYAPLGHSYRRMGPDPFDASAPLQKVRLIDDPDPASGKWIESVWRAPDGRLYGWYHAEELAPCQTRLFVPHIGALVSEDDGASWRFLAELLRAPSHAIDCGFANGFVTGGYGDFTTVAAGGFFYLHYSSYVADFAAQGVAVARYPVTARDNPGGTIEHWRDGMWRHEAMRGPTQAGTQRQLRKRDMPQPILKAARSWAHEDPDSYWGPALHFNRGLQCWVMLLNRAQGGRDIHQEGIYIAFNRGLDDPTTWSAPRRIVRGGFWYPQVIGLGPEDGDTVAGPTARFFITGVSEWEIRFGDAARPGATEIAVDKDMLDPEFRRTPAA